MLTISNMDDYKYLDSLLVTNSELGENGALYLQSIADLKSDELVDAWRDKTMFFPGGEAPKDVKGMLGLVCDRDQMARGNVVSKLDGAVIFKIEEFREETKPRMMELHISDAGICAATPHVTELKITWNGSRTKPRDLKVKTKESREWTKEDRQKHKEYIKNVEIRKMNFGFRDL